MACAPNRGPDNTTTDNCFIQGDQSTFVNRTMAPEPFQFFGLTPGPVLDGACAAVGDLWILDKQIQLEYSFGNPVCGASETPGELVVDNIDLTGSYSNEFEWGGNILGGLLVHCTAGRGFIDSLAPDVRLKVTGKITLTPKTIWRRRESQSTYHAISTSDIEVFEFNASGLDPLTPFIEDYIRVYILDEIDKTVVEEVNKILCVCEDRVPIDVAGFGIYIEDYDPRSFP